MRRIVLFLIAVFLVSTSATAQEMEEAFNKAIKETTERIAL